MLSGNDHPDTLAVTHGIVVVPAASTDVASEYSDDRHGDEENPTTVKPIFVGDKYTPIKVQGGRMVGDYMDICMRVVMAKKIEAIQTSNLSELHQINYHV
jgi:hypothetical protein